MQMHLPRAVPAAALQQIC